MGTFLIIFFVFFILYLFTNNSPNENEISPPIELQTERVKNKINSGSYLVGHPGIDESFKDAVLHIENGNIEIHQEPYFTYKPDTPRKGFIPIETIINISIEDKTTIEKRVTVGRLLFTGIFAFAWKKKDVKSSAFLIIEWQGGKFTHETIFEFTDKNCFQSANTVRNKLIAIS